MAIQNIEISWQGKQWYSVLNARTVQKACQDLFLPVDWVGKANRMDLVRGREPDRVTLLLPLNTLQALAKWSPKLVYGSSGFWVRWTFDPSDGAAGGGGLTVTHKNLFFIQASCLISTQAQVDSWTGDTPADAPNQPLLQNPFLVELADPRVLGQLTNAKVRYNVRAEYTQQDLNDTDLFADPADAPQYEPCSATEDDPGPPPTYVAKTNLEIAQALWAVLPSQFGSFPSFFPTSTFSSEVSEDVRYEGVNAWDAFCHFIGTLGVTVAFNITSNSFYLIDKQLSDDSISGTIEDSQAPPGAGVRLCTGGLRGTDCTLPKTVRVFFPVENKGCGDLQCSETFYTVDVTTSTILSAATYPTLDDSNLIAPIHDSLPARFDNPGDSTPTNDSDLNDRATAVATRYLKSIAYRGNTGDIVAGISISVFPSAAISRITVFDFGNGIQTQLAYGPNEDSFSRFPQRNRYVSPSDYQGSLDAYGDAFSPFTEPENDGYTGVRTRIIDMFYDIDNTRVIAQVEKANFVNGRMLGVCRLYDINFCAAEISGYIIYAHG